MELNRFHYAVRSKAVTSLFLSFGFFVFETVSVGIGLSATLILYVSRLKESYLWSKISSPGNGEVVGVSKSGLNSEKYRSPTGNSTLVLELLSDCWKCWKLQFDLRNVKFWPMFQTPFLFQNIAGLASSSEIFLKIF